MRCSGAGGKYSYKICCVWAPLCSLFSVCAPGHRVDIKKIDRAHLLFLVQKITKWFLSLSLELGSFTSDRAVQIYKLLTVCIGYSRLTPCKSALHGRT